VPASFLQAFIGEALMERVSAYESADSRQSNSVAIFSVKSPNPWRDPSQADSSLTRRHSWLDVYSTAIDYFVENTSFDGFGSIAANQAHGFFYSTVFAPTLEAL
jgi:hypothetical protein